MDIANILALRNADIFAIANDPIIASTMYKFHKSRGDITEANKYKAKLTNSPASPIDLLALVETDAEENYVRNVLLNMYATKLDKDTNLLTRYVKNGFTSYFIEDNYYFVEALLKITDRYPTLSVFAEDMAKTVIFSIITNFYYENRYSEDNGGMYRPDFYFVIHKRNDNQEVEKLTDSQGNAVMIGMKVSSYYNGNLPETRVSLHERLSNLDDESLYLYWNNVKLIGQQSGLITKERVIETEGIFEREYVEKYPFTANLYQNIRFNYQDKMKLLPHFPLIINFLDKDSPEFAEDSLLTIVEMWRQSNAKKFEPFQSNYIGLDSLSLNFPHIPAHNILEFSWENMPTRWRGLEDKTTRDFHDAILFTQLQNYKLINSGLRLAYENNNEKIINWMAFIAGVPHQHIEHFPLGARKRLAIKNKFIQNKRSTTIGFMALQTVLMNNFKVFRLNKPYQPFRTSVYRHTNGGIWAFEIQPNEYGNQQIPIIWKALSDSYTSARYLLIVTSLNLLTDLGNKSRSIEEFNPRKTYKKNDIVFYGNKKYRKLVDGGKFAPNSYDRIWTLYDNIINVDRLPYDNEASYIRNQVVTYKGHSYILAADESTGNRPDLPFTFWGEINMNREHRDGETNNIFYSGMVCTNNSLPYTNSMASHLSTAFRYPGSLKGDYSFRLHEAPFPRRDVMLGYFSEYLILNAPLMAKNGDVYKKTSKYILQNENQVHWGNILEDWVSADDYYEEKNK